MECDLVMVRECADQVGVVQVFPCINTGYRLREPTERKDRCPRMEVPSRIPSYHVGSMYSHRPKVSVWWNRENQWLKIGKERGECVRHALRYGLDVVYRGTRQSGD